MDNDLNRQSSSNDLLGIDWRLLAKSLAGECSEKETEEVHTWLAADANRVELLQLLRTVWDESGKHPKEFDAENLWKRIAARSKIEQKKRVPAHPPDARARVFNLPLKRPAPLQFALRIAAAVILLVGLPYFTYKMLSNGPNNQNLGYRELTTQKGERAQFRFSDGTKISLNAASSVRFPLVFRGEVRTITLQGEAYFDVTYQEGIPFIVQTEHGVVQVLGTEFNVRARPEEQHTSVVVAEGKVALRRALDDRAYEVVLAKGQTSSITAAGIVTPPRKANVEGILGWTKAKLIFDKTPLNQVVAELGRWYDLDCTLADTALGGRQLTAAFSTEPVREVLSIIAASADLSYEMTGRSVVFSSRE